MGNTLFPNSIAVLVACALLGQSQAQLFDCVTNPPNPQNTICLPVNATCIAASDPQRGLDSTLAEYMLAFHNIRRARLASGNELRGTTGAQPASRCISKLSWSADLAARAQRWADQCQFRSDANRNLNLATDAYVGQNIYAFIDPPGAQIPSQLYPELRYVEDAMNSWWEEVVNFDANTVNSYQYSALTGHYTQMAWGRTQQIGCGFRRFVMPQPDGRYGRLIVCDYWPGGNAAGQPVYQPLVGGAPSCISPTVPASTCAATTTFATRRVNGFLCEPNV